MGKTGNRLDEMEQRIKKLESYIHSLQQAIKHLSSEMRTVDECILIQQSYQEQ